MSHPALHPALPWYREPWPWLLMLGPGLVVVAGSYAAYLAVSGADGVVASDYYTQGLQINRQLARDAAGARLGLHATARFAAGRAEVELAGTAADKAPATLKLVMVHATRAGVDQTLLLTPLDGRRYAAPVADPAPGRWNVALEHSDWRLTGRWRLPSAEPLELSPGS